MEKLWKVVTAMSTIFGLIDILTKWISNMEFFREYIFSIIGLCGFIGLIVIYTREYMQKQRGKQAELEEYKARQKAETILMNRFSQFRNQHDGLSDGFGNPMTATMLTRHFTDTEINLLVQKGYVKLKIGYVF